MSVVAGPLFGLLLGGVVWGLGIHGWRRAASLARGPQYQDRYEERRRSFRRGSAACVVAGVFIILGSSAPLVVR